MARVFIFGDVHYDDALIVAYWEAFKLLGHEGARLMFIENHPSDQPAIDAKASQAAAKLQNLSQEAYEQEVYDLMMRYQVLDAEQDSVQRRIISDEARNLMAVKNDIRPIACDTGDRSLILYLAIDRKFKENGGTYDINDICPDSVATTLKITQDEATTLITRLADEHANGQLDDGRKNAVKLRANSDTGIAQFIHARIADKPDEAVGVFIGEGHTEPDRPDSLPHKLAELGHEVSVYFLTSNGMLHERYLSIPRRSPPQSSPARLFMADKPR